MLINFITALAWIWGVLMILCFFVAANERTARSAHVAGAAFLVGIPAWAWLIARYLL